MAVKSLKAPQVYWCRPGLKVQELMCCPDGYLKYQHLVKTGFLFLHLSGGRQIARHRIQETLSISLHLELWWKGPKAK